MISILKAKRLWRGVSCNSDWYNFGTVATLELLIERLYVFFKYNDFSFFDPLI